MCSVIRSSLSLFLTVGLDYRQRNIKRQMSDVVELALNTPTADMWDKVLVAFKAALAKAEEAYLQKATSQSISRITYWKRGLGCIDQH